MGLDTFNGQPDQLMLRIITFCFTFLTLSGFAQTKVDSLLGLAQIHRNNARYHEALQTYNSALQIAEDRWDDAIIYYRMANCFRSMDDAESAIDNLWKSFRKDPSDYEILYEIAVYLRQEDRIKEATKVVKRYIKKAEDSSFSGKGRNLLKGMELTEVWMANPKPFQFSVDEQLSSPFMEFAPTFVDDSKTVLMFSSNRHVKDGDNNAASRSAVYAVKKTNSGWQTPTRLDTVVNKNGAEGVVSFDHKRGVIFFTSCGYEKCELRYAFLKGDMMGESFPIRFTDNAEYGATFGHPSFCKESETLYFVSDMPGGFGGRDIWCSKYNSENDSWESPVNLGASVNSDGDEMFPVIHSKNTLYYSSNGHAGMGGMDLFKAEWKNEVKMTGWFTEENLGYPFNSSGDDFGIVFDSDSSGYLTSNRKGGLGSDDIYRFEPKTRDRVVESESVDSLKAEETVNTISNFVNSQVCRKPLEEARSLRVLVYPNPNDGQFSLQLQSNVDMESTLRLFSSNGKLIENRQMLISKGKTELSFDYQNQPKGVYYVQLTKGCETLNLKRVVFN